jgi:hypothetical protein
MSSERARAQAPSALEIYRRDLMAQCGVRTDKPPPKWSGDEHFRSAAKRRLLSRKQSEQTAYLSEIAAPPRIREPVVATGASPTFMELVEMSQLDTPGPGQYPINDAPRQWGGKFDRGAVKTFLDAAPTNPVGPGEYATTLTNRGAPYRAKPVVKFGSADRRTEVDELMKRGRQTPGPGANGVPELPRHLPGGRISDAVVPTAIDQACSNHRLLRTPHPCRP